MFSRLLTFAPIITEESTLLTIPVAVPGALLADGAAASRTDRYHSLRSLLPPPAALPSLPGCFYISFSFSEAPPKAPLVRGKRSAVGGSE